jgi:ribosomal protein S14
MGLVEDAVMARQLGYKSYGQYMVSKGAPPPFVRVARKCKVCGSPLGVRRRDFCTDICRKTYANRQKREMRERSL